MSASAKPLMAFEDFNAVMTMAYDEAASNFCHHDYWRVTTGFRYYFGDPSEATYVDIPEGYISDGASVPRIFWWVLPPQGDYGQAAVLHDFLCEHLIRIKNGQRESITRVQADNALRNAMRDLGVPRWKRNIMFIAVATYVKVCRIKGTDIDAKKAAYLAQLGFTTAMVPLAVYP